MAISFVEFLEWVGRNLLFKQIAYSFLAIEFMRLAIADKPRRYLFAALSMFFGSTVYLAVSIAIDNEDLLWTMRGINTIVSIIACAILFRNHSGTVKQHIFQIFRFFDTLKNHGC